MNKLPWLYELFDSKKVLKIYEEDFNVFGIYGNNTIKQLTFEGLDQNAILIKEKSRIIFLRKIVNNHLNSDNGLTKFNLMVLNIKTLNEEILVDQKPYSDSLMGSFLLIQPEQMKISPDKSKVLFVIEKYTTGSELVQVDIITGKFDCLFSAESFEFITSGEFKNYLLVSVSSIRGNGRDIYYDVVDLNGKILKSFNDYQEYMKFRSNALLKNK